MKIPLSPGASVRVSAALFAVLGLPALWLGLVDVLTAPRMQYQLVGAMFTLAGLALMAGSACLLRRHWRLRVGRLAAVVAGLAGTLVGGYLLVLQIQGPQGLDVLRLLVWSMIVGTSVGATSLALWATRDLIPFQIEVGKAVKGLISGVGIVGLLLGGVQWWYANQYLPGAIGAALSIETSLEEQVRPSYTVIQPPGALDPYTYPRIFNAEVKIKNTSDTRVQVVASIHHVVRIPDAASQPRTGGRDVDVLANSACFFERFAPLVIGTPSACYPELDQLTEESEESPGNLSGEDIRGDAAVDDVILSRHRGGIQDIRLLGPEVLQLGQAVPDGTYLEPEEEFSYTFAVHVPNNTRLYQDDLSLMVQLAVAKGERLVLASEENHGPEQVPAAVESDVERRDPSQLFPHRYEVTEWQVRSLSEIVELTRGPQSVNVIRVLSARVQGVVFERPHLAICFSQAGHFRHTRPEDRIREDPTTVCPGRWPTRSSQYEREMREFFGVTDTHSTDLVSLMPGDEQPAGHATAEVPPTIFFVPESHLIAACEPVFALADDALERARLVSNAWVEHEEVMSELENEAITLDEALDKGRPSLERGAEAAGLLADARQAYLTGATGPCGRDSAELGELRNTPCSDRVATADRALDRAMAMAQALMDHARAMDDLDYGRGPRQDALARSEQSMNSARTESDSFNLEFSDYRTMTSVC